MTLTELMVQTITKQIANPTRAVCNSESAFVEQALSKQNRELAEQYWDWVCIEAWDSVRGPKKFGQQVYDLQQELSQIGKKTQMPVWGTYGT
jgi:hypothetical protein